MNRGILIASVLLAVICLSYGKKTTWNELDNYTFEKYLKEFGKRYSGDEYLVRKQIFEQRLESIRAHNKDETKTWKRGINHLSDKTEEEFGMLLGYNKALGYSQKANHQSRMNKQPVTLNAPASIDWREKGVVSSVKDQGQCGSCWSFGTAEVVESHWAIATGHLTQLSEQQILDCTPNPNQCGGVGGCGGGTPELAYDQIIKLGGLSSEWTYPYISWFGDNFQCNNTRKRPVVKVDSYVVLPSNEYEPVLNALANNGPLAVNVDASTWSDYESGVYDGCNQVNPDIDHVVQLVGYGTDDKFGDYWLIRNSWTPLWGEDGYIRIRRDSKPRCGVDLHPSDGTGCNGGPSQVTVCGTCAILYDVSYPIVKTA